MPKHCDLKLRPSAAHRWASCTAYPALEAQVQPPETHSSAADEGTRLHAHMEHVVKTRQPLPDCTDRYRAILRNAYRLWSYADLRARAHRWLPEEPVEVNLGGAAPVAGTCDVVGYEPDTRTMLIIDWKFGVRHRVHALGNLQLALYAAGAVAKFGRLIPVEHIEAYIIQPRAEGAMDNPPERWAMTMGQLISEVVRLRDIAGRIYMGDTEFLPTEANCRWCSVQDNCNAYAIAQDNSYSQELGVMQKMYAQAGDLLTANGELP